MTRAQKLQILDKLEEMYPDAKAELVFSNSYEMLVATMLSAQCTDKQVNKVTPAVFSRWPDANAMAGAEVEELFPLVKSCGFKSKAGNIIAACRIIHEQHGGQVPSSMEELTALPGVGRKTANVVASVLYDEPVIAVDTHVFRVAHRLGLSDGKTPLAVERDLEAGIPAALRPKAHHWLILHGRYTCTARNPKCGTCGLSPYCRHHAQSR